MCIGVQRSVPYYWYLKQSIISPEQIYERNNINTDWLYLREDVTEWDFAGHVNKPVINYEYTFNYGILKSRDEFICQ